MPQKKDEKKVTVVAELRVDWEGGTEVVKSYDRAWRLSLKHTEDLPVRQEFLGFVRKED